MENTPILSAKLVSSFLNMPALIDAVESGLVKFSKGESGGIKQPVRSVLAIEEQRGFFGVMPAYSQLDDTIACKIVTFFPENKHKGLSTHQCQVMLYNACTGQLQCIMDGDVITYMRTAAASAVAAKHLASKDSSVLAILGSGGQARSHWNAMKMLFKFKEVRLWNIRRAGAERLAEELRREGAATVTVHDDAEQCVTEADVIITATFATEPVLRGRWVKDGSCVCAVGACRPEWRELDEDLTRKSTVYVDSREAALKEAGDILINKAEIYAEIGEIADGRKQPIRGKPAVFKSLGIAVEDLVSAKLVYDEYRKSISHSENI